MAANDLSDAVLQETMNAIAAAKGNQIHAADALRIARGTLQNRARVAAARGIKAGAAVPKTDDPQVMKGQIRRLEAELKKVKSRTAVEPEAPPGIDQKRVAALRQKILGHKGPARYVITAAQNATPVHAAFFASLMTYCEHNGAQLVVIPYRYKNPTSMWTEGAKDDDWWAPELAPYLLDRRTVVNKHLLILADIKTQPTATSPLAGFESISGAMSAVIGHPKLELTTVPTPQAKLPKILTTTGAVTRRNYLPAKAGKKGEFHHTFGACVVEVDGPTFHLRQLNAVRDGSFMDLTSEYDGETVREGGVAALVMGDTHQEFIDPQVDKATFAEGGIIDTLRPKNLVWHDAHDFYSRNHHHIGEPFIDYVKAIAGVDDVGGMLDKTFAFIDERTKPRPWMTNVFVSSNHPDALAKWVKRADWRTDPRNAKFLLQTALAMLDSATMGEAGAKVLDPFVYWAKQRLTTVRQAIFLEPDKSFIVRGVDLGNHGHYGLNGARGSRHGYSKIGVKVVIGHGHSPGIDGGAYQGGTNSILKLEFVKGPSSWMHTDVIVYENGKRSLLNIINGEWRLP
jgi:hypothetical protein